MLVLKRTADSDRGGAVFLVMEKRWNWESEKNKINQVEDLALFVHY